MKFILSTHVEQVTIKRNGIASKGELVDCKVSYFLESEENQIIIVRARHLLESDKEGRANYECDGIGYIKMDESFFGYLNHAIGHYLYKVINDDCEIHCDLDVLKKIRKVFNDLSSSKDISKLIETFRK